MDFKKKNFLILLQDNIYILIIKSYPVQQFILIKLVITIFINLLLRLKPN